MNDLPHHWRGPDPNLEAMRQMLDEHYEAQFDNPNRVLTMEKPALEPMQDWHGGTHLINIASIFEHDRRRDYVTLEIELGERALKQVILHDSLIRFAKNKQAMLKKYGVNSVEELFAAWDKGELHE